MLKTILVAADGSDHADKAVDWAIELAVKHGARLVLLYVAPHREVPPELRRMAEVEHIVEPGGIEARPLNDPLYPASSPVRPDMEETMVSSARIYREIGERILDAARFRAEQRGVKAIETVVAHGDPAHQIVRRRNRPRRRADRHGPARPRRPARSAARKRVAQGEPARGLRLPDGEVSRLPGAPLPGRPLPTNGAAGSNGVYTSGLDVGSDRHKRPQPGPENRHQCDRNEIFDLEGRHDPEPPRCWFRLFIILDEFTFAQERHPIFRAEILIQESAMGFSVVPSIFDSWAPEPISPGRAVANSNSLSNSRQKILVPTSLTRGCSNRWL